MKTLQQLKKTTFLFVLALFCAGSVYAQTKLVFVVDTTRMQWLPGDAGYSDTALADAPTIAIFEEDGYEVEIFHVVDLSTADPSLIEILDNADLIYIGRRVPSSNFESPKKEVWNELFPPIMTGNMWALRNNRLNWFNTTEIYINTEAEDTVLLHAQIERIEDELFEGLEDEFNVDLLDTIDWWYGPHNIINPENGDVGNGTVLATAAGGIPVFVRFEKRDEFYPGSVDLPTGERVYFGLDCEVGDQEQYYSRYTDVVKEIFLREAARLSGHFRGEVDVKNLNNPAVVSKVYFNSLSQQLVAKMDNLNKLEMVDISGKLVYSTYATSNRMFVDLSFMENGIYLVKLSDKNNTFSTHKIIK